MVQFIPGSQVWQLITLLSIVGEYPLGSRHLLGNKAVFKNLVHKLNRPQTFCNIETGDTMTCRLLSVSGDDRNRNIRLCKVALPILDWISPECQSYHLNSFRKHNFSSSVSHRERNHRIGEAVTMCMRAGIEARPFLLPELQNEAFVRVIPSEAVMYPSKDLKRLSEDEMSKTSFTRMVGALFACGTCYAMYNTRSATMKWSGKGEFKARDSLRDLSNMNAEISIVNSAILIGQSGTVALNTILESDKSQKQEFRFDSVYDHIYFIPLNEDGIRQLRILTVPDWKEKILNMLFDPEERSYNRGRFEYDAIVDDVYIYSYLDADIARLMRLHETLSALKRDVVVLCFAYQVSFLREYFGPMVELKVIDFDTVEDELGPDRRNLFEG
jgi:hypothetical protein